MKFTHLSRSKFKKFKDPKDLGFSFKPSGTLWFACNDDWEKWATENQMSDLVKSYKHKYTAGLDVDKLIVLKTKKDIENFTKKYTIPIKDYPEYENMLIDWNRVREETGSYGVYIVNPSIKTARFKYPWYSSFDICSVAVWDSRAILSIEEVKPS